MDEVILPFVDNSPETIARKAAEKAAAVDRELARTQPAPNFPPVRGEERVAVRAGDFELPHYSALYDPARVTGTHSRVMRQFRPRVMECVACEYKKLDTRLGDPVDLGLDPSDVRPEQRHHFGPGERDYTLCKSCYDTFGKLHPKMFDLYVAKRMREDQQRTLRAARNFPDVASRVAEIDRWRRDAIAAREFGAALETSPLGEGVRRRDGRYDGFNDDRVMSLSDFTEQSAAESAPKRLQPITTSKVVRPTREEYVSAADPEVAAAPEGARRGRSRVGDPDPMWQANDAGYEPERIGADHSAAIMEDEKWEARRTRIFRERLAGIEEIEDSRKRERARTALYRRWDPRLSPARRAADKAEITNPFAAVRKELSPYPRTTLHSGVDEGFAAEPAHVRSAHARHQARVEAFLADAPKKLRKMGYSDAEIKELTDLPALEPDRIRRYPLDDPPLRERVRAERDRNVQLPSKEELEQVAQEGAIHRKQRATARWARETAGDIVAAEVKEARTGADEFIDLAGRVHARNELVELVREADRSRELVSRWAHTIHAADRDLRAATDAFAREIKVTFHDPKAFQAAFKQLTADEKRATLQALRERPADFAREFRSAGRHDFGAAGRLATGRRTFDSESAVGEAERAGILTSEAGDRYLNAAASRENVRVKAARALKVPESTTFDGLRDACREKMKEANKKKSAALSERANIGKLPTRRELGAAFSGLTEADRTRVLAAVPTVSRMIEPRGRALVRTGLAL
jgi:hypothetical protein